MRRKKLFKTTAIIHPDDVLEVMGGAMVHVRAEAAKTPGARAVVLREVPPSRRRPRKAVCPESSLVAWGAHLLSRRTKRKLP